jgi:hypothetical protein
MLAARYRRWRLTGHPEVAQKWDYFQIDDHPDRVMITEVLP